MADSHAEVRRDAELDEALKYADEYFERAMVGKSIQGGAHAETLAAAVRSLKADLESAEQREAALVEALRGMVELNGYRERQLLVNAEWAFAIVSDAQAALTVYEQSQGNTE